MRSVAVIAERMAALSGAISTGFKSTTPGGNQPAISRSPVSPLPSRACGAGDLPDPVAAIAKEAATDDELVRDLFGPTVASLHLSSNVLLSSRDERCLAVAVVQSPTLPCRIGATVDHLTVAVRTDFSSFVFALHEGEGVFGEPFLALTRAELAEQISVCGSLWEFLYPVHFALMTKTVALSLPRPPATRPRGRYLARDGRGSDKEHDALKRIQGLASLGLEAHSLDSCFHRLQDLENPPTLASEERIADQVLRQYLPSRSSALAFGAKVEPMSKPDYATTYVVNGVEYHREFILEPPSWGPHGRELRLAAFDLANLLAQRRTKFFRPDFGRRVFSVVFPPVELRRVESEATGFLLFPCCQLFMTPASAFRGTISVSHILVPVSFNGQSTRPASLSARQAYLDELQAFRRELISGTPADENRRGGWSHLASGPLAMYANLPHRTTPFTLWDLTTKWILGRLAHVGLGGLPGKTTLDAELFKANRESSMSTLLLLVDWSPRDGDRVPWETWFALGKDDALQLNVFKSLFLAEFFSNRPDASHRVADLGKFTVGNALGADMAGLTLFNPQERLHLVLYPQRYERYPSHSIVRWLTWQVYVDAALMSLRAVLSRYYAALEARGNLRTLLATLDALLNELLEFYDLDIMDFHYRTEFERLRMLLRADSDYADLNARIAASREDESLREQRVINKLVLSLTLATVTVTVVSNAAVARGWPLGLHAFAAVATSGIVAAVGYMAFDPVRSIAAWATERLGRRNP